MKFTTLANTMGHVLGLPSYLYWNGPVNEAMRQAGALNGNSEAANIRRSAMMLAMMREESIGLSARQELGSPAYLEAKDYYPYIGRGFIQLTWDYNYRNFGHWLHDQGKLSDPEYFVNNYSAVSQRKYAALTMSFYWHGNHNHGYDSLNAAADADDIYSATLMVNGGTNGLAARTAYYNYAKSLGTAILPEKDMSPDDTEKMVHHALEAFGLGGNHGLWTQKKFPKLIRGPKNGVLDRIAALEEKIAHLEKK